MTVRAEPTPAPSGRAEPREGPATVNEVHLIGRLSAPPSVKLLPSGTQVVQLRVVVDRPADAGRRAAEEGRKAPTVDTIDIACWRADVRRRAMSFAGTEAVEVNGSLRRRFWRSPAGVASRYEVEAMKLRKLKP
ncbi:single-stranded DNA-binding protein [Flexivirga caeni]|uniref:Single-stranded DNA-binding protein n=1 Tax=Flexivirga caeni TaxID=2294115 RepID=A0A3M9LXW5_9MICO|nr:single-stranded DNA-binding protein [Flexivirga caeni]RNI18082.1 single-stranded DNA-binding protein [Flexivirga caeni]